LQYVFGFRVAAGDGAGGTIQPLVVAAHDHFEQAGVAGEHTLDHLVVGELLVASRLEYALVHWPYPYLQLDECRQRERLQKFWGVIRRLSKLSVARYPPYRQGASMPRRPVDELADSREVLLEIWVANERMNQLILERLNIRAWRMKVSDKSRNIAAIFAHVHNIRRKWLKLSAPHLKLPKEVDRARLTRKQAQSAFRASAQCCSQMITDALASRPRAKKFRRDGWAPSWHAGPSMVFYMLAHEAHHRGQVLMLAHQLGFPLPAAYDLWNWDKLWKQCGFKSRPR
jgi:uncharacterized damage-inducible protein DinB